MSCSNMFLDELSDLILCVPYLQELANAKGNILENKELLDSLNKTKESSMTITKSLLNSQELQASLDKVCTYYKS